MDIITKFQYNIGDCLFDAIVYYLYYSMTSITIRENNMAWLQKCLMFETPEALECHRRELKFEFLHDLHHGQAINDKSYIQKMSKDAIVVGYGVIILVFWISKYLQHPFHVSNKSNG